jgi:hypothetical protein
MMNLLSLTNVILMIIIAIEKILNIFSINYQPSLFYNENVKIITINDMTKIKNEFINNFGKVNIIRS